MPVAVVRCHAERQKGTLQIAFPPRSAELRGIFGRFEAAAPSPPASPYPFRGTVASSFLPVLAAPPDGLSTGTLKPPPGRASRKSVPPEGLPRFSACPSQTLPAAGSLGAVPERPRWSR